MKTLLVVMNILAFLVSFGAILWAWRNVRTDIRDNADLLDRLNEIERAYASGPHGGTDGEDRQREKRQRQIAAGKTMFTYSDLDNMPELVKNLIYTHALSGLGIQVFLVGLGLALGTLANVLSLYVPAGD